MRIVPLVLGGCLLALAPSAGAGDRGPTYTNDDLERLAPRRAETGVASVPAFRSEGEPAGSPHDEAYWRREADRLREQLRPLRQRAIGLQLRIDRPIPQDRKAKAGAPSSARTPHHRSTTTAATTAEADRTAALRAQLQALQEQIREREARLEERARREGALPGWLR